MKKLLFIIGLLAVVITGYAQEKTYRITSSITNLADTAYSLTIWDGTANTLSKTGTVVNGQVFYEDTTSVPLVIRLTFPTKSLYKMAGRGFYPVKSQSVWLVAIPGKTIHLTGHLSDFAEVYPEGDVENETIRKLNTVYHPLINNSINITVQLGDKNETDEATVAKRKAEQADLDKQAQDCMVSFLKSNVNSIAGLYYLNDMLIRDVVSIDLVDSLLPTVSSPYKETAFYQTLAKRVEGSKYDVGKQIFSITTSNTYDGVSFSTDQWKGKFYLIDFWGSWCGPCMADVPALKKLKESFPGQLKVLGIAQDKEANWRKAIEEHQLNWSHILNGTDEEDFVARLNVMGFPTKILVDPKGNIVYRSTGGGETSFDKMAEIIKSWKE